MSSWAERLRTDRAVAWMIFAGSFLLLFASEASVGFVRDESVYFFAAESYAGMTGVTLDRRYDPSTPPVRGETSLARYVGEFVSRSRESRRSASSQSSMS